MKLYGSTYSSIYDGSVINASIVIHQIDAYGKATHGTRVDIFVDVDKNGAHAMVNWSALGSQSPLVAGEYARTINVAATVSASINNQLMDESVSADEWNEAVDRAFRIVDVERRF